MLQTAEDASFLVMGRMPPRRKMIAGTRVSWPSQRSRRFQKQISLLLDLHHSPPNRDVHV